MGSRICMLTTSLHNHLSLMVPLFNHTCLTFMLSTCHVTTAFLKTSRFGKTVLENAIHSLCAIVCFATLLSRTSYNSSPRNTEPMAVSMASVASLRYCQTGMLFRDMLHSVMERFLHQLTSSLAHFDS